MLDNLARASDFVREVAKQGAQLVLFPEFMPQGYRLTPELWEVGLSMGRRLTGCVKWPANTASIWERVPLKP